MPKHVGAVARMTLLLILGILMISPKLSAKSISGMLESESVKQSNEVKTYKHHVSDDFKGTELKLDSKLTAGTAVWKVRNPEGKVVWQEAVGAGQLMKVQRLQGSPGVWSVEVALQSATGKYKVRLKDF